MIGNADSIMDSAVDTRRTPGRSTAAVRTLLGDAGAAVDDVGVAGDPARLVAGQERGQVGDVLGLAEAPRRHARRQVVAEVLDEVRGEVGLHEPGGDADDAGRADLAGELAGHVDQRRLGDVVDAEPELRAQAADRGDVDDHARLAP